MVSDGNVELDARVNRALAMAYLHVSPAQASSFAVRAMDAMKSVKVWGHAVGEICPQVWLRY